MNMDPDLVLGRKAVEAGFVTREQLQGCLKERDEETERGGRRFLGKILVERGLLSFFQLVDLLKAEEAPAQPPDEEPAPAADAPPPTEPPPLDSQATLILPPEALRGAPANSPPAGAPPADAPPPAEPPLPDSQSTIILPPEALRSAPAKSPPTSAPPAAEPPPLDSQATLILPPEALRGASAKSPPTSAPPPAEPPPHDSHGTIILPPEALRGAPAKSPPTSAPPADAPPPAEPPPHDSQATLILPPEALRGASAKSPPTSAPPPAEPPPHDSHGTVIVPPEALQPRSSASPAAAGACGTAPGEGAGRPVGQVVVQARPEPPAAALGGSLCDLDPDADPGPLHVQLQTIFIPAPKTAIPIRVVDAAPIAAAPGAGSSPVTDSSSTIVQPVAAPQTPRASAEVTSSSSTIVQPSAAPQTPRASAEVTASSSTIVQPVAAPQTPRASAEVTASSSTIVQPSATPRTPGASAEVTNSSSTILQPATAAGAPLAADPAQVSAGAPPEVVPGRPAISSTPAAPQAAGAPPRVIVPAPVPRDTEAAALLAGAGPVGTSASAAVAPAAGAPVGAGAAQPAGAAAGPVAGAAGGPKRAMGPSTQFRVLFSKRAGSGSRFGRYQLVSELARGAMGIVYRAFDPELKRTVALKVMLQGEETGEEQKSRFQREALLAARLHHPNIVQVYDVGEAEGRLFYTMQFIEGSSLQHILDSMGRIPLRVAVMLVRDAARALHYAHENHVLHRDIKPANLLITSVGARPGKAKKGKTAGDTTLQIKGVRTSEYRVLVSDFGIAKDISAGTILTQDGTVLGTPAYMSPEQAGGRQERIGPASDVYSLGALLYQLLSGQTPFTEPDPVKCLVDILQKDPPPLGRVAPDVHPDLEIVVGKAMEKDPRRRYPTADGFAEDLDRFLAGDPIHARRRTWMYRTWRFLAQRRRLAATVAALLLVGLVAALHSAVLPWVEVRRLALRVAAEQETRALESRRRLARAQERFASRDLEGAAVEARALVTEFAAAARRGEDLPVAAAHDLLARAFAESRDGRRALQERFRGLTAALGRPEEEEASLALGRALLDEGRPAEAARVFERAWRTARGPARRAEAAFGRGRAAEGAMRFRAAAAWFGRALAAPELPDELRAASAAHRGFCLAHAREIDLPLGTTVPTLVAVDLDGDGRSEVLGARGTLLFAGVVQDGSFREQARLDLHAPIVGFVTVPRPAADRPSIFVALRDRLCVVRGSGTALEAVGGAALDVPPGGVAWADLDGDRRPEAVTWREGERPALEVWGWDEGRRALERRVVRLLDGDAKAVERVDPAGAGRDSLAVFGRERGACTVSLLAWDAARGGLTPLGSAAFGLPRSLVLRERPGRAPQLLVGTGWTRADAAVQRRTKGSTRFEELTPPAGASLLLAQQDGTFVRVTLAALDWKTGAEGSCHAACVRGKDGDRFWCALAGPNGGDRTIRVFAGDEFDRPFALLVPPRGSAAAADAPLLALDVDGDGAEEIAFERDGRWTVLDEGPASGEEAAPEPAPMGTSATADRLLELAADSESAAFWEEAIAAYRDAEDAAEGLAARATAVAGRLRCLAGLGQAERIAGEARAAAAGFPALAGAALVEGVRALDAAGRWADAARLAGEALDTVALEESTRAEMTRALARTRGLAEPPRRAQLVGPEALPLDWLATSPLVARRGEGGAWTVHAAPGGSDTIGVPLGGPGSWRLAGTVQVQRQPADTIWRAGAGAGRPELSFALVAAGEGDSRVGFTQAEWSAGRGADPVRSATSAGAGRAIAVAAEQAGSWPDPIAFEVAWIAHRSRLEVRSGLAVATLVREAGVAPDGAGDGPHATGGLAGIETSARHGHGTFRLERLDLEGASEAVQPTAFAPMTATDHVRLANGRWIQERPDEALALYDKGARLGDLERAKEEEALAAGLPSAWDGLEEDDPVRWAWADARFWRALLLAARGEATWARAGLWDVWGRAPARVRELLRRWAPVLQELPAEAEALQAFWDEACGHPGKPEVPGWAQRTLDELGPEAVELLIEGVQVAVDLNPAIGSVAPDGPAARAGLRPSDVLLRVDDTPVSSGDELAAAIAAASQAGKVEVVLAVARDGRVEKITAPARDLGIETYQVLTRTLRFP